MSLKWIQDLCARLALECQILIDVVGKPPPELQGLVDLVDAVYAQAQALEGKLTTTPEPVEELPPPEPEEEKTGEGEPITDTEVIPGVAPESPSPQKRRRRSASEKKTRGAAPHG